MDGRVTREPSPRVVVHRREHFLDARLVYFTLLIVAVLALVYLVPPGGSSSGGAGERSACGAPDDSLRQLGHELAGRGLYEQAMAAYEDWIVQPGVAGPEAAALAFTMGDLCKERLSAPDRAVRWYLAVRHYDPASPVLDKVGMRVVACLEALGKRRGAQNELDRLTSVGPARPATSPVAARIGARDVTVAEVDEAFDTLPPAVRAAYPGPEGKVRFLQEQFLAPHVLAEAGRRRGLDRDASVANVVAEVERNLVAQKVVEERLRTLGPPARGELELWYKAEGERYREKPSQGPTDATTLPPAPGRIPPLDEVRDKVAADYDAWRRGVEVRKLVAEQVAAQQVFVDPGAFAAEGRAGR